jgi:hypothetical protein
MNRRLLAVLSLASLSVLGACGSSTPSGAPKPGVEVSAGKDDDGAALHSLMLAAATKVADTATSRFEMQMSMPGPDGKPLPITSTGAVNNTTGVMSMEMDMGAMGVPGMSGTTTALFDGKAIYYRFPPAMRSTFGGKEWVKMGLDLISKTAGLDVESLLQQFKQSDPTSSVALLSSASTDITEVGTEDIRGVHTRHFKMTVDLQKASTNAPESLRSTVAKAAEMLGTGTYPAEIWLGDDGLPRRMHYSMDISRMKLPNNTATPFGPGNMEFTMDLFDFGVDVGVVVPPASDTADMANLLKG